MTLDKSGKLWRGDDSGDLAEYVRHFKAGGYPVATVVESRCGVCDGRAFRVNLDEDEATQRVCLACGTAPFIGDGAEHWSGSNDPALHRPSDPVASVSSP